MPVPTSDLASVLGGSEYALQLFDDGELSELEFTTRQDKLYLTCFVTGKRRLAKPEEVVRQLYARRLVTRYGYPLARLRIEKPVYFGSAVHKKAADIVVVDSDDPESAYIIVEVKKPKRRDGVEQLKSYCNAEGSPIGIWSNGGEEVLLHREEPNIFVSLTGLPRADESLSSVLEAPWTLADLTRENKLVREQTTLKEVILSMENLVLANAGVDAFDEVFKLIYAKLYDESEGARNPEQNLRFRVRGESPREFYSKIDSLFREAQIKWPGVFLPGERIELSPDHLVTCGSFMQDIKLFNSNLQVIDEAFEYLSVEVGKGKKGQYFTPRHVIDMAVKMLSPTATENVIDTAAGSCGFTVHSMFHVWGNEFAASGPLPWQSEYARERVYAIDFDPRSVRIAKALNLIAGDGRTNVYRANTLDPRNWSEEIRVGLRHRLRRYPSDPSRDRWNQEHYREFDFDLLLTNPPFAGDITDTRILHQYELARREGQKWHAKRGRDVLFLERNLEFLRPGGRMAIVLPQGRLNNSNDAAVREWLFSQGRILAVVSLPINTFKPHTSTKTSILFMQKWNDDPAVGVLNPRLDDYPIFFGISEQIGKDTSGEYEYLRNELGGFILDDHGHMIVEHDLDGIVEAFAIFKDDNGVRFS